MLRHCSKKKPFRMTINFAAVMANGYNVYNNIKITHVY